MNTWTVTTRTPDATRLLGEGLGRLCEGSEALLLEGDLGSGKTCFVQGVARGLGVPPEVPVNSPTYTLMNHYEGRMGICHFDLYRLNGPDDLDDLEVDACLHGAGVTIVEWAGLVDRRGLDGLAVEFGYGATEDERRLLFSPLGDRGARLLKLLAESWKGAESDGQNRI